MRNLIDDLPRMLPNKFRFIWQNGFREQAFFRNQPIRSKNYLWRPCLLTDRDEMSNLYRGPSINNSYQISAHLGKRFQRRRFFRNQPIRNKNFLWWPIGTKWAFFIEDLPWKLPTKFRFIWPSGFRGEEFKKSTNQKQEPPVAAMLVNGSGQNEQFYRGPSIDASYQVSVHFAKRFQRRRF